MRVARGTLVEQPIHLIYVTAPGAQPQAAHPRALIVAEGGSEFAVVESYLCDGDGAYFSNAVTEIVADSTPSSFPADVAGLLTGAAMVGIAIWFTTHRPWRRA